jgi:hypothetical protein
MDDTRTIIPIADQEAATDRDTQIAALQSFCSQWTLEEMPACPVGMELLYYFSLKYPGAYDMARPRRFMDPPPPVTRTLGWKAYCDHQSSCFDCQEGGAQPIRYEGGVAKLRH